MKRIVDIAGSLFGLLVFSPILIVVTYLVWRQDHENPFYIAPRTGLGEKVFKMLKLRSMIKNADKSGVDSTSSTDMRITPIGAVIRRYKLDEISQLWNVLLGDMSLVGPRPNVKRETDLYTEQERQLLTVRPGITDFSSIVFSDEGAILEGKPDADLAYNQLIRPWKSRLGLFYIKNQSIALDFALVGLTVVAIVSRPTALKAVTKILEKMSAPPELTEVASRTCTLIPFPPPGMDTIVTSRASEQ